MTEIRMHLRVRFRDKSLYVADFVAPKCEYDTGAGRANDSPSHLDRWVFRVLCDFQYFYFNEGIIEMAPKS